MRERLLGSLEFDKGCFPAPFELAGNQPIVGADLVILPLGERSLVAVALDLLLCGHSECLVRLMACPVCKRLRADLGWCKRRKKGARHGLVDGTGTDVMADWQSMLRA